MFQKNKMLVVMKGLKFIFSRVVFLYLFCGLLLINLTDVRKATEYAKFTALSRYIPNADQMEVFKEDWRKLTPSQFKEFELYYEKFSQFVPRVAEVHGMKGFCYYYNGQIVKAERAYLQALKRKPGLFNFHYNLGIIALKQNNHKKALQYFRDSVAVDPIANVQNISASIVYISFLPSLNDPRRLAYEIGTHARDQYRRGYLQLLWMCEMNQDYVAMLGYAKKALSNNFPDPEPFYYYASLGAYFSGDADGAVSYSQDAIRRGFQYAQVYHTLGMALQKLKRKESEAAFLAAMSLAQDKKIYHPELENLDLLIY